MSNLNRAPSRQAVEAVLNRVATEAGVPVSEIVFSVRPKPSQIRFAIWREIITDTGCSVNGLATVWGVDNSTVRSGLRGGRAAR